MAAQSRAGGRCRAVATPECGGRGGGGLNADGQAPTDTSGGLSSMGRFLVPALTLARTGASQARDRSWSFCEGLDSTLQMTRYPDAENARKVYMRIFPVLAADWASRDVFRRGLGPNRIGDWRLVPTTANRMPTAASYLRRQGQRVSRVQVRPAAHCQQHHRGDHDVRRRDVPGLRPSSNPVGVCCSQPTVTAHTPPTVVT